MNYEEFLKQKEKTIIDSGFDISIDKLNPKLFKWQKLIVRWAIKKGRCALFEDCGLGKSFQQLEWSQKIYEHTQGNILIFAPLAVSEQTKREGEKFGYRINICKNSDGIMDGINVTNYERLEKFNFNDFAGIVSDESSIYKAFRGKTKEYVNEHIQSVKYRLCCTATPSPNDHIELGNHSEILGHMPSVEMRSTYFVNDGRESNKWRLKGWSKDKFWQWVCSWAVILRNPADIGFYDERFNLPSYNLEEIIIDTKNYENTLFFREAYTMRERQEARKKSIDARSDKIAEITNNLTDSCIVWCDLNEESKQITSKCKDAVEITGNHSNEYKAQTLMDFCDNKIKCLVTKPKIAGFGMNFQNCHNVIYASVDDSFEKYYQSLRRMWRFGQNEQVNVKIVLSKKEGSVLANIRNKEKKFHEMVNQMTEYTKNNVNENIHRNSYIQDEYKNDKYNNLNYSLLKGDCVKEIRSNIKNNSIDFIIYSPPFSTLYVYTDDIHDMGNSHDDTQFMQHYQYLIKEKFRILKQGKITAVHCGQIPAMNVRDGYIGLKDFRGDIIREHEKEGFIYFSEVVIWKCPLLEVTRTKTNSLSFGQLQKDSAKCRMGRADYILIFRKPGEPDFPVTHSGPMEYFGQDFKRIEEAARKEVDKKYSYNDRLAQMVWREYASPIWMDIRITKVLNTNGSKDNRDERHLCPLQLDVIGRLLILYTNQGDLVLSPFAGIGSEGYQALQMKRKFIGIELKQSYYDVALKNLQKAENKKRQLALF